MKLQLLRNATLVLTTNNRKILIDPMLGPKASYDAIPNTANNIKNPVVDMPITAAELTELANKTDAVLLTHIHRDHWDETAKNLLIKSTPVYTSGVHAAAVLQAGFTNVIPVDDSVEVDGMKIFITGGQHGTGEIGKLMGQVFGFVIESGQQRIYIAGDTIWCDEVARAIDQYQPDHIIVNGSAARFNTGDPIIMDVEDILKVCRYAPKASIYVVHLESVNHVTESRADIKAALLDNNFEDRAHVPDDGEVFINK